MKYAKQQNVKMKKSSFKTSFLSTGESLLRKYARIRDDMIANVKWIFRDGAGSLSDGRLAKENKVSLFAGCGESARCSFGYHYWF